MLICDMFLTNTCAESMGIGIVITIRHSSLHLAKTGPLRLLACRLERSSVSNTYTIKDLRKTTTVIIIINEQFISHVFYLYKSCVFTGRPCRVVYILLCKEYSISNFYIQLLNLFYIYKDLFKAAKEGTENAIHAT